MRLTGVMSSRCGRELPTRLSHSGLRHGLPRVFLDPLAQHVVLAHDLPVQIQQLGVHRHVDRVIGQE